MTPIAPPKPVSQTEYQTLREHFSKEMQALVIRFGVAHFATAFAFVVEDEKGMQGSADTFFTHGDIKHCQVNVEALLSRLKRANGI